MLCKIHCRAVEKMGCLGVSDFVPVSALFFGTVSSKLSSVRNKYGYSSFSLVFACEFVVHEFNQDKMFEVVISKGF